MKNSNKLLILCGPTASGKTFLREKLEKRGFTRDISYTTRPPRPGEWDGIHYHFISTDKFTAMISNGEFYEHVKYNGYYYGTGLEEWNNNPLFIMETDGISKIKPEDRENCFIIYMNPPEIVRINRINKERKWDNNKIAERLIFDHNNFKDFNDYDIEIVDSNVIF